MNSQKHQNIAPGMVLQARIGPGSPPSEHRWCALARTSLRPGWMMAVVFALTCNLWWSYCIILQMSMIFYRKIWEIVGTKDWNPRFEVKNHEPMSWGLLYYSSCWSGYLHHVCRSENLAELGWPERFFLSLVEDRPFFSHRIGDWYTGILIYSNLYNIYIIFIYIIYILRSPLKFLLQNISRPVQNGFGIYSKV